MGKKNPLKQEVVEYYFANNVTYEATIAHFKGKFCYQTLIRWVKSDNRFNSKRKNWSYYPEDVKLKAVSLYHKEGLTVHQICKRLKIKGDSSVRFWLKQYDKYGTPALNNNNWEEKVKKIRKPKQTADEKDKLIYELQLENDILREAFKLGDYPKERGLKIEDLTVTQKTQIIQILRPKYQFLNNLLDALRLAKSAYDYSRTTTKKVKRDKSAREYVLFVFEIEPKARGVFGSVQVWHFLRNIGIKISEKVIRRWMRKLGLTKKVKKCRKYYSYMGCVGQIFPNLIDRDFHADLPNQKWLTDITEFHFNDIKVYLSWIVDCFNGEIIAHTISQSPNMELVLTMLDKAFSSLKPWENPILHSDMGHQYQRPAYVQKLLKSDIIQSMSKKGCSPDNSACEGAFGLMKNEFFYGKNWDNCTYSRFASELSDWIDWFNRERGKPALNGLSPVRYRVNNQKHIMFDVESKKDVDLICYTLSNTSLKRTV